MTRKIALVTMASLTLAAALLAGCASTSSEGPAGVAGERKVPVDSKGKSRPDWFGVQR